MKRLLFLSLLVALLCGIAPHAFAFVDSAGRGVDLPEKIDRIAPASPMAQMVLFALCPEKFVGISSKWPSEAEAYVAAEYLTLPVLGQLYSTDDLNLEELARLDPQVVIDIGETKANAAADMDQLTEMIGIPAVHVVAMLSDMAETYRTLGDLLGCEARAEELALYCEEIYGKTLSIVDKIGDNKRTLLYCLGSTGLNVVAKGSFHAEVLDLLGDNVAVVQNISSKGGGNEIDMEQLYLWDPEVIIFQQGSVYAEAATDPMWRLLRAIQSGRYVEAPVGPYNWLGFPPSINRYLGLVWLANLLYPQDAGYDLYAEAARYYDLFYHSELPREAFEALTATAAFR